MTRPILHEPYAKHINLVAIKPTPEEQSAERCEEAARESCEAGLCDPKTCRYCREASPADYYRRKQQEVDDIIAQMEAHEAEHKTCDDSCIVRGWLEKRLERARYVGD